MTLADNLASRTRPSELCEPLTLGRLRCLACAHRCPIGPGQAGVCKVRFQRDGRLMVPYGYVGGMHSDPIEKKPFFHALPGARAFSFGMLGCNFHCGFCQNWLTSQTLRDRRAQADIDDISPRQLVRLALAERADCVVSTYNEPLIGVEWAVAVFREARACGLSTGLVSNGYATPEVLAFLRPWVDLFKVDLKGFDERRYHALGARLQPVLESIRAIHALGFWLEVVTLVVPGFNDSEEELTALAGFLAGVSVDIPWHVSAFHPAYRMNGTAPTSAATLLRAAEIGRRAGLRYVYAGNAPGRVDDLENTRCPQCRTLLVERSGYRILRNQVTAGGTCPLCQATIAGFWPAARPLRAAAHPTP